MLDACYYGQELKTTYHQSRDLASWNFEREVVQHRDSWARGVGKVEILKLNLSHSLEWSFSRLVKGVDMGLPIDEAKELGCARGSTAEVDRVRCETGQADGSNDDGEENTRVISVSFSKLPRHGMGGGARRGVARLT